MIVDEKNTPEEEKNSPTADTKKERIPKTDAELKQIAMDLYDGKIFSDRHLKNMEDAQMVFMPIALGAFSNATEEEMKDLGMIYEYLSEAGPRSVNGMPCFMSFQMLTRAESEKTFDHYEAYKKLKEEFTNPT